MVIEVLNTRSAQVAAALIVGLPLAAYGGYRGWELGFHAYHMSKVHMGHNMSYTVNDCQVVPGGQGSKWGETVTVHNGNPDTTDDYGVQVQFFSDGKPLAWTKVVDIGNMESGSSKTLRVEATVNESGSSAVTCVPVFYRADSPAGDTSPVPAK